jgi:hypothetical protein
MSQVIAPLPRRQDLIFEGYANLNGLGEWTSTWAPDGSASLTTLWYDSAGIDRIRIVANVNSLTEALNNLTLAEAMFFDGSNAVPVRYQTVTLTTGYLFAEFDLTARFFQLYASGYQNDSFALTVKAVSL